MAKLDNLLATLWMLSSDKKITAKQISDKLEMNIRTVYRYMDTLSKSGVPIISDIGHNGGYTLLNEFVEAPLFFNSEEQTALCHAADFAEEAGYYGGDFFNSAITKLKNYSNLEKAVEVEKHTSSLEVIKRNNKYPTDSRLEALECCVADRNSVIISYRKSGDDESIDSYFPGNLLPIMENEGSMANIVISGDKSTLDGICQHWFLGHYLKERTFNRAEFQLEEDIMHNYIPQILLPYGKGIQVLEPLSLKEEIINNLYNLIEFYQK
ncbi:MULTISPECIES: HTH domain-containing protein [unclassified Staphylococcus]|uniref:helix-turn-helix transcriptional regulator n=1 Tax=unclassified Staphylococcus TaxID=91994 RepID=UPI001AEC0A86